MLLLLVVFSILMSMLSSLFLSSLILLVFMLLMFVLLILSLLILLIRMLLILMLLTFMLKSPGWLIRSRLQLPEFVLKSKARQHIDRTKRTAVSLWPTRCTACPIFSPKIVLDDILKLSKPLTNPLDSHLWFELLLSSPNPKNMFAAIFGKPLVIRRPPSSSRASGPK